MTGRPGLAPDQPAANDPKYVVIELRERIAELEALQALDREYMDKAEIRISELEARIQRDEKYRDELLYSRAECVERAEQAEARYSDVIAEHENELALRLEAEAALAERDRMLANRSGITVPDGWTIRVLLTRAEEGSGDV